MSGRWRLAAAVVVVVVAAAGLWWVPSAGPPAAPPAGPLPPLHGLVVYLSAGHGWLLHRTDHDGLPITWAQQRPLLHGMVEDDWTADFVAHELAPALEAAGATVVALRERDRNPTMVVVDDGDAGWSARGHVARTLRPLALGGDATRLSPHSDATWRLRVPDHGHWYLYARWTADAGADPAAVYTARGGGHATEVVVDQRAHGGHWWPLSNWCLPAGAEVQVTLSGSGAGTLSADAVRLGGGSYHIVPETDFALHTHPMWQVAMPHQLAHLGAPPGMDRYECGNAVSDMRLRSHWASWASPPAEDAVYLSIHTNATPDRSARGLEVYAGVDSDPPTDVDPLSLRLAHALEDRITAAVQAGDPDYATHGVLLGDFSEISPIHNALPSVLLELGFHDDPVDAARLQTSAFQDAAVRGIVAGLTRWHAGS